MAMAAWKAAALAGVMLLGIATAQDGPNDAIAITLLPFSTTGDSTGFLSTVALGGGPDVFFVLPGVVEVRRIGGGGGVVCLKEGKITRI